MREQKSPWEDDDAFDAMFEDVATFHTVKTTETKTLRCCIFPIETVDPFAESDSESDVKRISVLARKDEWDFNQKSPSVGDSIELRNGERYKVAEVRDEQNWWRTTARSVQC